MAIARIFGDQEGLFSAAFQELSETALNPTRFTFLTRL
jgi:hypothetical protein